MLKHHAVGMNLEDEIKDLKTKVKAIQEYLRHMTRASAENFETLDKRREDLETRVKGLELHIDSLSVAHARRLEIIEQNMEIVRTELGYTAPVEKKP